MARMSEREWSEFAAARNLDPQTGREKKVEIADVELLVSETLVEVERGLVGELKKLRHTIERLATWTCIGFAIMAAIAVAHWL